MLTPHFQLAALCPGRPLWPSPVQQHCLPLRLQEEDSQGWKCQIQRERLAMCGYGFGEHTSGIPLITTTVGSGITVQEFAPIPPFGHAYAMVVSHHWREVSNHRNDLVMTTAQETEHAAIRVVGIHPLESARITFALVESRFTSVEVVQVLHPGLHSGVQRELKDPPLQAFLVGPLALLPELVAHEEQLLARLRPLISEEQAQVGKLLPLVARHLADERAFTVHHLIVRERQHVVLGEHIEAAE